MELEYFDEPRKCEKCQIITFCDRCPICGKILPRSAHSVGKKMQKLKTAGEDGISQPKKRDFHHGEIKTRTINPKIVSKTKPTSEVKLHNEKRKQETQTDKLSRDDILNQANSYHTMNYASKLLVGVVILFVGIVILNAYITTPQLYKKRDYDTQNYDTKKETDEQYELNMEKHNPQNTIHDEIRLLSARYNHNDAIVTMFNESNQIHYIDIILYQENEQVATNKQIRLLPKEQTVLDMKCYMRPDAYAILKTGSYEIDSIEPNFDFRTLWDDKDIRAYIGEIITQEELEILVRFLYETNVRWNEINDETDHVYYETMMLSLYSGEKVHVTINDQEASLKYYGKKYDYQDVTISLK